jgi:hypothetical protein
MPPCSSKAFEQYYKHANYLFIYLFKLYWILNDQTIQISLNPYIVIRKPLHCTHFHKGLSKSTKSTIRSTYGLGNPKATKQTNYIRYKLMIVMDLPSYQGFVDFQIV